MPKISKPYSKLKLVLDIRGTNGSGKSYVVRELICQYDGWDHPYVDTLTYSNKRGTQSVKGTMGYYLPEINGAVVGSYTDTGGGCDSMHSPDLICNVVRHFARQCSVVVLEGITVAHTHQRYSDLAEELGTDKYHFLFLDTPVPECIKRVEARRLRKGNDKPFNPKNLLADDWRVEVALRKLEQEPTRKVLTLDWQDPYDNVMELIRNA